MKVRTPVGVLVLVLSGVFVLSVAVFVVAGFLGVRAEERASDREQATCRQAVEAAQAQIRTTAPPAPLPDVYSYVDVHWLVRYPSSACSRGPGLVDKTYQGVVRLHPGDAQRLAAYYEFAPVDEPAGQHLADQMSPQLAPFLAADPTWRRSHRYDASGTTGRSVLLDVEHDTLFFTMAD